MKQAIKDFLFGAFIFGMLQHIYHVRAKYDDIFHALLVGEFLGIPLLGNYYTLRLLPHIYGELRSARLRLLREVDLLELLHEGPSVH